ncbi:MAG: sulfite exporter TauE/SafE family protein, partial [Phycisphaeraceae bacterium]|nr:sulfite exporter TauE/SafE family protein [Phycisphaeraceae bacterium]
AAAMIVNVCVAIPATYRHHQHKAINFRVLRQMIPAAMAMILIGVWVSNLPIFRADASGHDGPVLLGRLLALFMVYVIVQNLRRLKQHDPTRPAPPAPPQRITAPRTSATGATTGLIAGLLGIGGGAVAVPLQQVLMRLDLRNCIANSAALICLTAGFGAVYKNLTLAQHGLAVSDSLAIAAGLAPSAILGGFLGGRLTHTVPKRALRIAFIGLMVAAAIKLAQF